MKIDTIQTSFVTGELGPPLLGRTDTAQYSHACALVQNFLIRPFGSLLSTPGTRYIATCSSSTGEVRLIPFVFSVTDSYIIEMGVGYFRFYTNGAVVVSPGTTPYQISHSYAASDISTIQYCQDNDVIYLAHANYPPQTLTRLGATNWVLANFAFTGGPFQPTNTVSATTISVSATGGTVNLTVSPTNANLFIPSSASTTGHNNSYWLLGSTVTNATTGLAEQRYVQITNVVNSYTATASVISVLSTSGATTIWAQPSWCQPSGWPARCTFFQSRLFFARTITEPQTIWASSPFNFVAYAVNGGADDDALDLQLSATESNDIKWLAPMNDLIAGTYGGEFSISAGLNTGNPLTPATVGVIQQTSWGSEPIPPKKIGNFAYYVQRYAQKLREIFYEWTTANYKSTDKTVFSPQINGGAFIDMAYQQNPDTVLWMVCTNGTIATMTREIDQQIQGWTRQTTAGSYTSIAIIPSQAGPYDEVWVTTSRTINNSQINYIEQFASQIVPASQDQCFYVHCGSTYDAYAATSANTATSISLSATSGTIVITSSSAYFSSGQVGNRIRAINANRKTLGEMKITGFTSSTIVVGTIVDNFSALSYAAGSWGVSVTTVSGLTWLEAATVKVLADGGTDKPDKVVSNGTITLAYNYFVINVGLAATQTITTLPQEAGSERGTSQGKKQRINEVAFKLNNSYTGFLIGGTTSNVGQFQFRNPATLLGTPPPLFTGTIPNILFVDDYRYGAQMVIQNNDPLPMQILSIITSLDTHDK